MFFFVGETESKKRKESATKSDAKSADAKDKGKAAAKAKNGTKTYKTVQDDPNASEVYKNLFTSCDEAKNQKKPHSGWVTFNPQYFR